MISDLLADHPLITGVTERATVVDDDHGPMESLAVFSPCLTYRYVLGRRWDHRKPVVAFLMLNPSTATHLVFDPTVRRCFGYATAWGFGTLLVGNCFALRSTDPRALRLHQDPIGPDNDRAVRYLAGIADTVVVAWGSHGKVAGRGIAVFDLLQEERQGRASAQALQHNRDGHPVHPLYQPKDRQLQLARRPLAA